MVEGYLVDVGVLLDEDDKEFSCYLSPYDGKHSFYDELQYYELYRNKAIRDAVKYVMKGVEKTYAVVSCTVVPEMPRRELLEMPLEGESYALEDVVFSCAKINGIVKENFLVKSE